MTTHVSFALDRTHLLGQARFLEEVRELGYCCLEGRELPVDHENADVLEGLGTLVTHWRSPTSDSRVIDLGDALCSVYVSNQCARLTVAAHSDSQVQSVHKQLAERFRPADPSHDELAVAFWSEAGAGGFCSVRTIESPGWSQIASSQPSATRDPLEVLMATEQPASGRLILWHGEPGTGKTSALRALAREWSEWCVPHYVTDPEALLRGGAAYLFDILTASDHDHPSDREWRLVILEDAGELLSIDAHEKTGHALARLLNASDGFVGQGTNTIMLITTNEPIGALHPAVTRPGRCLAEIEFVPLPVEQANAWLAAQGSTTRVAQPTTIAECAALLDGRAAPRPLKQYGFAA